MAATDQDVVPQRFGRISFINPTKPMFSTNFKAVSERQTAPTRAARRQKSFTDDRSAE